MDIEVQDDGKTNPLVIVSADALHEFLRKEADKAGYSDRSSLAVQCSLKVRGDADFSTVKPDENGMVHLFGTPRLVLTVSNIPGSREPA